MSFQQALSGLNAASRTLEVIGNNVANASTVGFKQSQASFADVFASSLAGGGASQIGIGTQLTQVAQQFTQGNITITNNPLDLAINGSGFFRVQEPSGAELFTRNGQFQLNDEGFIINPSGMHLMGYPAAPDGTLAADIDRLRISFNSGNPSPTAAVSVGMNLDSSAPVITTPIDMTDSGTYNHTTSLTVYDSLGNARTLQTFHVKTAANTWDVYASINGHPIRTGNPLDIAPVATLAFDGSGNLNPNPPDMAGWNHPDLDIPGLDVDGNNLGADPLAFGLSFGDVTQFSGGFSVSQLRQDGFPRGELAGFSVGADGKITGRYTNGASLVLGQVELATFRNPNGLQSAGNNVWAFTAASGEPTPNLPGQGNAGMLQAATVEESNVDLTAELVKMITAQRFYQANAQTIKTQDQAMQTLVNLR